MISCIIKIIFWSNIDNCQERSIVSHQWPTKLKAGHETSCFMAPAHAGGISVNTIALLRIIGPTLYLR